MRIHNAILIPLFTLATAQAAPIQRACVGQMTLHGKPIEYRFEIDPESKQAVVTDVITNPDGSKHENRFKYVLARVLEQKVGKTYFLEREYSRTDTPPDNPGYDVRHEDLWFLNLRLGRRLPNGAQEGFRGQIISMQSYRADTGALNDEPSFQGANEQLTCR
jgi:hypothetical protein